MGRRGNLRRRALVAAASVLFCASAYAQEPAEVDPPDLLDASADVVTNVFGDAGVEQVFTPVTPCRLFDTRLTAAGRLAADTQRTFHVAGTASFAEQGGNPGGCGIPAAGASAVMLNLTAVTPMAAGNLRAWAALNPVPPAPLASVVNYNTATYALANAVIVPVCNPAVMSCPAGHLRLQADSGAVHVVGDVVGYFQAPTYNKPAPMSGVISARYVPHAPNSFTLMSASYPRAIPSTPLPSLEYIVPGGATTSRCPGPGSAAAGYICIYGRRSDNVQFVQMSTDGNTPYGFSVDLFMVNPAAPGYLVATWTVGN